MSNKSKFVPYKNKSSIYKVRCRYTQGGVSEVSKTAVKWWERDPSIAQPRTGDYTISSLLPVYVGRPDLLSRDLYGEEGLEWIILQANNIVDINEEFVAGISLTIPSIERVNSEILLKQVNFVNVNT